MLFNKFQKQIDSTYRRFIDFYKPGDFVFGFITDVHSGGNKHYKHYDYFFTAANKFHASLMVDGGDIGLGLNEDRKETDLLLKKIVKHSKTNLPYIFVKGNHDSGIEKIPTSELYSILMKDYIAKKYRNISLNDKHGCGVYLDDKNKLAIIFINTSDTTDSTYIISDEQIHWLIYTLTSINNDYRIILISHLCMDKIGMWKDNASSFPTSIALTQKIIYDFINRRSDKYVANKKEITWDFTKKKNVFLFELAGDSHFDNYVKKNGLNIVVRQGYGGILIENVADNGVHVAFSENEGFPRATNCLFDFVCVKPNNTCKIFRVGVNDIKADLEF